MNIKDKGSMFFENFNLQKEYTFLRIKASLDKIKELLDNENKSVTNNSTKDLNNTLLLIYKSEVSVLIPLAQWFNGMVELKYWQSETLQEALKIIWKV